MTRNRNTQTPDAREVRAMRSTSLSGDEVPQRVLLAPWGHVESTNGSFIVDDESARLVVQAFEDHGTDLPIDYEHQTLGGTYASPCGQAPAAGWIKRIFPEPGVGLLADIEWTDQATERLASKEYRYLSPVAIVRKSDRKLAAIHSAALTNKPAIVGMEPIVNGGQEAGGDHPLALLRAELALSPDAAAEEVLLAASERLVDLRRDARQRHVEERILEAMRAGKLVDAQRAWAEELVAREEALFDDWLASAPVVVTTGASRPPNAHSSAPLGHHAIAARARSEYRGNRLLGGLTTEEAFVADAVRQAGALSN